MLKAEHLLGSLPDEQLYGVLVAHPVATADGVVRVRVEAVLGADHGRRPTLRRHRVTPHRIDLGGHRHAETWVGLGHRDCRPEPRPTTPDQEDVVVYGVHRLAAGELALFGEGVGTRVMRRPYILWSRTILRGGEGA